MKDLSWARARAKSCRGFFGRVSPFVCSVEEAERAILEAAMVHHAGTWLPPRVRSISSAATFTKSVRRLAYGARGDDDD